MSEDFKIIAYKVIVILAVIECQADSADSDDITA